MVIKHLLPTWYHPLPFFAVDPEMVCQCFNHALKLPFPIVGKQF
jgi:hypothetical protein